METKTLCTPFQHFVCDGFLSLKCAKSLTHAVLNENGPWVHYDNDLEKKRALNRFSDPLLVKLFNWFQSSPFLRRLESVTGIPKLMADPKLHGGGIHVVDPGGHLGRHVDYAMHPTHLLERRLNLILFLSDWGLQDGGELELYQGKELVSLIEPVPGRVVLWEPTECQGEPLRFHGTRENTGLESRISAAVYYLADPRPGVPARYEALFAPNRSMK